MFDPGENATEINYVPLLAQSAGVCACGKMRSDVESEDEA